MTCPYLDYRSSDGEESFDHERPYCTVAGEFVSPLKADLCNDRFEFHHGEDCEIYRTYVGASELTSASSDD